MIVVITRSSMAKAISEFADKLPEGVDAIPFDMNLPDMDLVEVFKRPNLTALVMHDALAKSGKCPMMLEMGPVVMVSMCDDIDRIDLVEDPANVDKAVLVHTGDVPVVLAISDDPEQQETVASLLLLLGESIRRVSKEFGADKPGAAVAAVRMWSNMLAKEPCDADGGGDG